MYTVPMEEDLSTIAAPAANQTVYAVPMASDAAGGVGGLSNPVYTVPMAEDDGGGEYLAISGGGAGGAGSDGEYLAIGGSDGGTYYVPTEVGTQVTLAQPAYATSADVGTAATGASGITLVQLYGQADDSDDDGDDGDGGDATGASIGDYIDANNLVQNSAAGASIGDYIDANNLMLNSDV